MAITSDNQNTFSQRFADNASSADNISSKTQREPEIKNSKQNPTSKLRDDTGLTDAQICSQIMQYREECYQREIYIRDIWLACYDQYRNKQDFSNKADWQSQIVYPNAHAAVKHFSANIMKLLKSSYQWMTVDPAGSSPVLKQMAPLVEKAVLTLTDDPETEEELRDAFDFAAAIGVGILRIDWTYGDITDPDIGQSEDGTPTIILKTSKQGKLKIRSIDPFHMWWGPRTRNRRRFDFCIEESEVDVDTLKDMGASLENISGLENLEQVSDQTFFADQQYTRDFQRYDKREGPQVRTRKQAQIWEFWGDIIDPKTQEVVARNKHIVIANRTYILKYEDNPYWDELPPYILFGPEVVAGRWPEQGILEQNLSIKSAIDEQAQMQQDHTKFSVVPMLEVVASALENAEGDMQTGVSPGKIFYTRGGNEGPAVTGVQMPQLGSASFEIQAALSQEYQKGTFITNQTQGLTETTGDVTATEVQSNQLQSSLILSDIAKHIEATCLRYLAECVWSRAFQFMDSTSHPNWESILNHPMGQMIDTMRRQDRIKLLTGRFSFSAHGLSRAIERQQLLSKITALLQTLAQLGPNAMAVLNMPQILLRIFEAYHFPDPEELLSTDAVQLWLQRQQVLANQGDQAATAVAEQNARTQGQLAVGQQGANNDAISKLIDMKLAQMGQHPDQLTQPQLPAPAAPTQQ